MDNKKKICFVCLGNIVRSPLAENLFLHQADAGNVVEKYEVDSAGTSAYHIGERPDARMRRVAASHGLTYDGEARRFLKRDLDYFDLIIAMDRENIFDLEYLISADDHREKIHLLREFDPLAEEGAIVPDPYYGGIHGFEEVYKIVERSTLGLLQALEADQLNSIKS